MDTVPASLRMMVLISGPPPLLAPGTGFVEDDFSRDEGVGWLRR